MNRKATIFLSIFVLGIAVFAIACPKRVTIAQINANPSHYQDREIAVAGTVKDSYGVSILGTSIRGGAYQIDDGTGSIWVVTNEAVPSKGAQIGVSGKVANGVNWNGKNYGLGMYENDRRIARH